MKAISTLLAAGACAALSAIGSSLAWPQAYPTKPVRVIAPSGAGGPVDLICRVVAQGLTDALKQQFVVENRVGAAGLIGTEIASKAAPDGYTLLFGFSGPLAIVPNLNPNTPYDPTTDLVAISQVASAPYVLLTHPSVPAKNVKELVALAKSRPGKMNFGSGGVGVGIHMAGELFSQVAGIKLVHVAYKGAAPAMTAVMAGEVDMMFNGIPPTLSAIKAGKVRVIAIGSDKRTELLPGVPTILESGINFSTEGWYGFVAPKGTPQPVIDTLHKTLTQVMTSPDMKASMAKLAVDPVATSPAAFAKFIRAENVRWAKVIDAAGLKGKAK
ncbi:MAG TPA: tripartite tricarboxylate transporter substrate binding protein [Burkholderiales bacterium]|nr:tripartite tricarboxylate transporter substrate binding protein [Burkholderiales bacterium]